MNRSSASRRPVQQAAPLSNGRRVLGGILLSAGLIASGILSAQHLTTFELPGCGRSSECARAMQGTWGMLAGWPVAFIGASYFAGALAAWISLRNGGSTMLRNVVRLAALVSVGYLVLIVVERHSCPYCLVTHIANLAFWLLLEFSGGDASETHRTAIAFVIGCGVVTAGLIVMESERKWKQLALQNQSASKPTSSARRTRPEDVNPAPLNSGNGTNAKLGPTGFYRLGPDDAAIRVVIFSDYQCKFCAQIDAEVHELLKQRNDVAFFARHYPLCTECNPLLDGNLHPNACRAAKVAETAGLVAGNEGFWKIHQWLFAQSGDFTDETLRTALPTLGFDDSDLFFRTLQETESQRRVAADVKEARALGIDGTPSIFINGSKLRWGDLDQGVQRAVAELTAQDARNRRPGADGAPYAGKSD